MTNEELNTRLYEKMFAEQEQFRDWLLSQPPAEILNHAYEYTVREDISVKVSTGSAQIKGHTEPALPTSKFSGQNGRMTKTVRRNQGQLGLALQGSE